MTEASQLKISLHKRFLILTEELYYSSEPNKKTPYLGEQREARLFGAIVFLGFALESFINEVVNERCQDVFDSIEQIPLPDKWFIISKLSTKNILQKNKEPFQSIVLIFKLRNQLAHFKPKFMDYNAKSYQQMRKINHSVVKKLYNNSIEAMKLLAKEFNLENQEWLEDKKL